MYNKILRLLPIFLFCGVLYAVDEVHDNTITNSSEIITVGKVEDNAQKIDKFLVSFSKQDCDAVVKFLKHAKNGEKLSDLLISYLLTGFKEGFFFYSSILTGFGVAYMMGDDKGVTKTKTGLIISGVSVLLAYVMMKIADKNFFSQRSENQVLKSLLDEVREIKENIS